MEMYYLVFALWNKGAIVIPEKYQKEQCEQIGLDSKKEYFCVKAPSIQSDYCKYHLEPSLQKNNYGSLRKVCD